jgi:hypothetical protein
VCGEGQQRLINAEPLVDPDSHMEYSCARNHHKNLRQSTVTGFCVPATNLVTVQARSRVQSTGKEATRVAVMLR